MPEQRPHESTSAAIIRHFLSSAKVTSGVFVQAPPFSWSRSSSHFLWRWEAVSSPRKRSNHDPSREASREKKDELSGSKNQFETWGRHGVRCLGERVKATTEACSLNSRLHLPIWELAWVEPLDYEVFSKVLWQLTREIYQSDESALTQH